MENRVQEKYKKCLEKYIDGDLKKALNLCEECMSESLKFAPVLNLKGLILYQQGKLEEAISVWKINREINDDNLSKTYIKDALADEERLKIYIKAEKKLRELEVTEAIELLKECTESDFNCIKVNTALALCYLRKGEYEVCNEYVQKVLSVDKNYGLIKEIEKEINLIYKRKRNKGLNKKLGIILLISVFLGGGLVGINYLNQGKDKVEVENNKPTIGKENTNPIEPSKNEEVKLNIESLKKAIDIKDFDKIHILIKEVDSKSIKESDKEIYEKALKLLKKDGAIEFYNEGQELYNKEKFKESKTILEKAYIYGKEIYVYEHILYYLSLNEIKLDNEDKALKYLEEYDNKFKEGSYEEDVLYKLTLLNDKKGNLETAKKYGRRLKKDFPKSIYNNTNVTKVLEK